ncbi:hypothetical protein C8J56DRAFT_1103492 [Mycena floridula]|nr:hypothetical protein C8J56DRAFT_1103492 [Mycena floridula]
MPSPVKGPASRKVLAAKNAQLCDIAQAAGVKLERNFAQMVLMDHENERLRKQLHAKKNPVCQAYNTGKAQLMTSEEMMEVLLHDEHKKLMKVLHQGMAVSLKAIKKKLKDLEKAEKAAAKGAGRGRGRGRVEVAVVVVEEVTTWMSFQLVVVVQEVEVEVAVAVMVKMEILKQILTTKAILVVKEILIHHLNLILVLKHHARAIPVLVPVPVPAASLLLFHHTKLLFHLKKWKLQKHKLNQNSPSQMMKERPKFPHSTATDGFKSNRILSFRWFGAMMILHGSLCRM